MLNKKSNPVEWTSLMYELEDAKEHLSNLIAELDSKQNLDEADLKIQMGHVYAHLNRVFNSRNHIGEISTKEFVEYSKFPVDIDSV